MCVCVYFNSGACPVEVGNAVLPATLANAGACAHQARHCSPQSWRAMELLNCCSGSLAKEKHRTCGESLTELLTREMKSLLSTHGSARGTGSSLRTLEISLVGLRPVLLDAGHFRRDVCRPIGTFPWIGDLSERDPVSHVEQTAHAPAQCL